MQNLEINTNTATANPAPSILLPFRDYMEMALFNPKWGYYGAAMVDFEGDFQTEAKEYAPLLAERCYKGWLGMVETHEIDDSHTFTLYEFGAGTGIMASIILKYAHGMAVRLPESKWAQFYNVLHYRIAEISPELVKKQTTLLQDYINQQKVSIQRIDARRVGHSIVKGAGIVLSNELIDAFAVQKISLHYDEKSKILTPQVMIVAATITEATLKKMVKNADKNKNFDNNRFNLYKQNMLNNEKKWSIPEKIVQALRKEKRWIIDKNNMNNLLTANSDRFSKEIILKEWSVPLSWLPRKEQTRIREMIAEPAEMIKCLMEKQNRSELSIYLHTAIYDFLEHIPSFLTKGFIITIDYGHNGWDYYEGLCNGKIALNTFSKKHRSLEINSFQRGCDGASFSALQQIGFLSENHPKNMNRTLFDIVNPSLKLPGQLDITVQVNFSDIDHIGKKHQFKTIFFGSQDELGGYIISPLFKLLIQQFNIQPSNVDHCKRHLLEGMKQSSMISYSDMAQYQKSISSARQHLLQLQQHHSWKNLKAIFDWFIQQNYLTHSRSVVSDIETFLFGPIPHPTNNGGILTRSCFLNLNRAYKQKRFTADYQNSQTSNLKKFCFFDEIIKDKQYAEILLSWLMHNIYLVGSHDYEEYLNLMDHSLKMMRDDILKMHPDLDRKVTVIINKMKNFNFIVLSDEQKSQTHLSHTLMEAEQAMRATPLQKPKSVTQNNLNKTEDQSNIAKNKSFEETAKDPYDEKSDSIKSHSFNQFINEVDKLTPHIRNPNELKLKKLFDIIYARRLKNKIDMKTRYSPEEINNAFVELPQESNHKAQQIIKFSNNQNTIYLEPDFPILLNECTSNLTDFHSYYDNNFINLLTYQITNSNDAIHMSAAKNPQELGQAALGELDEQTIDINNLPNNANYAFIPLNVAYNSTDDTGLNHWAAVIVDAGNRIVIYCDPAATSTNRNKYPSQVSLLRLGKPEWKIVTSPLNFQVTENIKVHCGAYIIEVFRIFECMVKNKKMPTSGTEYTDEKLTVILSEIPFGEAEDIVKIRQDHIALAHQALVDKGIIKNESITTHANTNKAVNTITQQKRSTSNESRVKTDKIKNSSTNNIFQEPQKVFKLVEQIQLENVANNPFVFIRDFAALSRDLQQAASENLKAKTFIENILGKFNFTKPINKKLVKTITIKIPSAQHLIAYRFEINNYLNHAVIKLARYFNKLEAYSDHDIMQKIAKREIQFLPPNIKKQGFLYTRYNQDDLAVLMLTVNWEFSNKQIVKEVIKIGQSGEERSEVISPQISRLLKGQSANDVTLHYRPKKHTDPSFLFEIEFLEKQVEPFIKGKILATNLGKILSHKLMKEFLKINRDLSDELQELNKNTNMKFTSKLKKYNDIVDRIEKRKRCKKFQPLMEKLNRIKTLLNESFSPIALWVKQAFTGKPIETWSFIAMIDDAKLKDAIPKLIYPLMVLLYATEPSRDYPSLISNIALIELIKDGKLSWSYVLQHDIIPASFPGFVKIARAIALSLKDTSIRSIPGPLIKSPKSQGLRDQKLSGILSEFQLELDEDFVLDSSTANSKQQQTTNSINSNHMETLTELGLAYMTPANPNEYNLNENMSKYLGKHMNVLRSFYNNIDNSTFDSWFDNVCHKYDSYVQDTIKFYTKIAWQKMNENPDYILKSITIEGDEDTPSMSLADLADLWVIQGEIKDKLTAAKKLWPEFKKEKIVEPFSTLFPMMLIINSLSEELISQFIYDNIIYIDYKVIIPEISNEESLKQGKEIVEKHIGINKPNNTNTCYWIFDSKNKNFNIDHFTNQLNMGNIKGFSVEKYPKQNINCYQTQVGARILVDKMFKDKNANVVLLIESNCNMHSFINAFQSKDTEAIKVFEFNLVKTYKKIQGKVETIDNETPKNHDTEKPDKVLKKAQSLMHVG